jgi:hypothetical protein
MTAALNAVQPDVRHDPGQVMGVAAIARQVYAGSDIEPLRQSLITRLAGDPEDAAALLDAGSMLLLSGQREAGLGCQAGALAIRRHYRLPLGRGDGLKVLALVTAGDMMANTPIDFLLEGSDVDLRYLYVDADTADLSDAPAHDVLFMAVGESKANKPVLENIARLLKGWPRPVVNGEPQHIATLTRDGGSALLAGEPSILCPVNVRVGRADLVRLANGVIEPGALIEGAQYPVIVRPIGLHAGDGLAKARDGAEVHAFLAGRDEDDFYLAPYVDYAGPDGLFRKQRIVFIEGRAYPSHQAASEHWIVHYLSAGMATSPAKRQEEAKWMETFDQGFATRHAQAFAALHQRLGLDYFGIDSAETHDGRLLVFEVDVAMIVHAMDDAQVYPYKKPAMRRLFDAFLSMLTIRAAAHPQPLAPPTARA